jgi:hypothetical protein
MFMIRGKKKKADESADRKEDPVSSHDTDSPGGGKLQLPARDHTSRELPPIGGSGQGLSENDDGNIDGVKPPGHEEQAPVQGSRTGSADPGIEEKTG